MSAARSPIAEAPICTTYMRLEIPRVWERFEFTKVYCITIPREEISKQKPTSHLSRREKYLFTASRNFLRIAIPPFNKVIYSYFNIIF